MEWQVVRSNSLKKVKYDEENETLWIVFRHEEEKIYIYKNVPKMRFTNLMRSISKGRYFVRHIKGHYPIKKVMQEN